MTTVGVRSLVASAEVAPVRPNCQVLTPHGTSARVWASLDEVSAVGVDGSVRLRGWLIDRSSVRTSPSLAVVRGTVATPLGAANGARPDVANVVPGAGPAHGFDGAMVVEDGLAGSFVIAATLSDNVVVQVARCSHPAVTLAPFGWVDSVVSDEVGTVSVEGWAFDPGSSEPVEVVAVAANTTLSMTANLPRADVSSAFRSAGPNSGFFGVLTDLAPGPVNVCVVARNRGPAGSDGHLGCRSVVVAAKPAGAPRGRLEAAWQVGEQLGAARTQVRVRGWAYDPKAQNQPVSVVISAGGLWDVGVRLPIGPAIDPRLDLEEVLPGAGVAHGFDVASLPLINPPNLVCAYAVEAADPATPTHWLLGCVSVVPGNVDAPRGSLQTALSTAPGEVVLSGWAVQPPGPQAVVIRVRLTGPGGADPTVRMLGPATVPRPEVAAAFVWAGPNHGFEASLSGLGAGPVQVCVDALGQGPAIGIATVLGCRSITMRDRPASLR